MIDLHTHSFLSDGILLPSELIQQGRKKGYKIIAITDHVDSSNMIEVISGLKRVCADMSRAYKDIQCIPGVELTHIPPVLVKTLTQKARKAGAKIVVFHGETTVEPVEPGSNKAAILAKVDILAHPGRITEADAKLAKKNNVMLEITARGGHNLTNGHVARVARKTGAKLVFDTDAHSHNDLVTDSGREKIFKEAGLNKGEIKQAIKNSELLVKKFFK